LEKRGGYLELEIFRFGLFALRQCAIGILVLEGRATGVEEEDET